MMRWGSVGLIVVAAACFVLGSVAVAIPQWGHFRNRVVQETGHFGPWTLCKEIDYGRKMCGPRIVMFRPMFVVYAAGVCAAVGVAFLGAYGLLSIFYVTILSSPTSKLIRYKVYLLIAKLVFSLAAALMTVTAVGLFATQGDDLENGYIITLGLSFFIEVVVGIFSTILMLLTVGEYVGGRREVIGEVVDAGRTEIGLRNVIGNPGYRDRPTNGISVTRSSGVPYVPSLRYKYNSSSNNNTHNNLGGSGRRRTPPHRRPSSHNHSNSHAKTPTAKPFAKDLTNSSWNGSANSVTTSPPGSTVNGSTVSDMSSVSTVSTAVSFNPARGPLRSSLKKSRTSESGFGISNPGFSGSSPTLSRTSSLKKVRIQSPTDVSTDV